MDKELIWCLQQGPTSVKELARLTGKSTSTIYKLLKADGVIVTEGDQSERGKLYSLPPAPKQDGPGDTAPSVEGESPTQPAPDAPAEKRGRKATGAGKKLTATCTENGRRKGSHGFKSLQIIIDNPGITTEKYLELGGRLNDLRWDIAHGNVKVGE